MAPANKRTKPISKSKIKTSIKGAKGKSTKTSSSTFNNIIKSVKNVVNFSTPAKKLSPLEKITSAFNKSQLIATLSERAELSKKQIGLVLDEFSKIMGLHLKKGGPEKFVLPGAFKIVVRKIPAKKARKGINPFTGQPAVFQAKPASRKVKIIALKSLKDMAI